MKSLSRHSNHSSRQREIGASLVEYGLLLALIALIAIPSLNEIGWRTWVTFCHVSAELKRPENFYDWTAIGNATDLGVRETWRVWLAGDGVC